MLAAAVVMDPTPKRGDRRRVQGPYHCLSPHMDSSSNITPPKECGRDRYGRDLRDIIHNKDARDRIENRRQKRDRTEREERDHDFYGSFYNHPHRQHSPDGGHNEGGGGVKAFSHVLKRVRWPLNFKPSGIEKYDGLTNPTE
jgi:hypothetical protein